MEYIVIDPGNKVECDMCSKDFTHSNVSGGFLFESKGVCPECAPRVMNSIEGYNEQRFIRGTCPPDKSFADWIREDCR